MKTPAQTKGLKQFTLQTITAALVIGFFAYGAYSVWAIYQKEQINAQKSAAFEKSLEITEKALALKVGENQNLFQNLSAEQNRNNALADQITGIKGVVSDISGTVNTLEKLRKLDPELLEKYSKVYFLSENYIPAQLSTVDTEYIYNPKKPEQFHSQALPFLERMFEAAKGDGPNLKIISAYRSFDQQAAVKSGYKVVYGSGANKFSADQGYSEHQLGTTVDLSTTETKGDISKFESSPAYKWMLANAYKFGFELSYPKNNSYYQFEPWHWRFIGVALATKLHDENKNFYDLTQREIDTFLISIFD